MTDEAIVGLYWDRNEDAIRQTQLKYGSYLSKVADNILANLEDIGGTEIQINLGSN